MIVNAILNWFDYGKFTKSVVVVFLTVAVVLLLVRVLLN